MSPACGGEEPPPEIGGGPGEGVGQRGGNANEQEPITEVSDAAITRATKDFRRVNSRIVRPTSGSCVRCATGLYKKLVQVYGGPEPGLRAIKITPAGGAGVLKLNAQTEAVAKRPYWTDHAAVELPDGRVVDPMLFNPSEPIYPSVSSWEQAFLEYPDPQLYTIKTLQGSAK